MGAPIGSGARAKKKAEKKKKKGKEGDQGTAWVPCSPPESPRAIHWTKV